MTYISITFADRSKSAPLSASVQTIYLVILADRHAAHVVFRAKILAQRCTHQFPSDAVCDSTDKGVLFNTSNLEWSPVL